MVVDCSSRHFSDLHCSRIYQGIFEVWTFSSCNPDHYDSGDVSVTYVSNALVKYTPIDDVIEKKCIKMFMPEISADDLSKINLSGTPLENLTPEQIASLGETDWSKYGLSAEDIFPS